MTTADAPDLPDLESLILSQSVSISETIASKVSSAGSEEDIRHHCNKCIDQFIEKAQLKISGRHEYEIGGGFLDSKYSRVLLEYKYPHGSSGIGPTLDSPGSTKVVSQIKSRFLAFHEKEHRPYETLLGIAIDGVRIIFVRRFGDEWSVDAPAPITPYTVERLLRALVSLGAQGYSFTPTQLATHFGSGSHIAQQSVHQFYSALTNTDDKKTKVFFAQWKIFFGEVCGADLDKNSDNFKTLAKHYGFETAKPAELLFCIHTFYAVFMKFLAAQIIGAFATFGISVLKKCVAAPSSSKLRREMEQLEKGGIWADIGITNFLEGDLFAWYLTAWDEQVAKAIKSIVSKLDEYDPRTLSVDVDESRDLLKLLYQHLLPRTVRHGLGEYYTPDWLAEEVLDLVGYDGNPDLRVLDPACGSGTFLVLAINRIKQWFNAHRETCGFDEAELAKKVLSNVLGFDLNPLAVMAARTNFLLAFRDLLKHVDAADIPVYLCDSVLVPTSFGNLFTNAELGKFRRLPSSVGDFLIPQEICQDRASVARYAASLDYCVKHKKSALDFLQHCKDEGLTITEEAAHKKLYNKLVELDKQGENGIWALIIKNSFAPLFTSRVDYIVGNPPWVNWESLPENYRKDTEAVWTEYKLTGSTSRGHRQASDKAKTDIAFLMTYVGTDVYLKAEGKLGFVITQTGFQSELGGRAFRRFELPDGKPLGLVAVQDMVGLQPFGREASNRTSVLLIKKGQPLAWPMKYQVWEKTGPVDVNDSLPIVKANTKVLDWVGYPIKKDDPLSSWIVGRSEPVAIARSLVRGSDYKGIVREGVNTRGANGIFYVQRLETTEHVGAKFAIIRNLPSMGRRRVTQETGKVDEEMLYPLLAGRDVQRWVARPQGTILLPHWPEQPTNPIPESSLHKSNKHTLKYLSKFENELRARKRFRNFNPSVGAYYGLYKVGTYTFKPYKVVWREIASDFIVAPVFPVKDANGNERAVIPNHKLMIVPVESKREALYLAAMLNSTMSRYTVLSYTITTQISTHVLEHIGVPQFDSSNAEHSAVVEIAKKAAKAAEEGTALDDIDREIDDVTRLVWGATKTQVKTLREALGEIREALSEIAGDESTDEDD